MAAYVSCPSKGAQLFGTRSTRSPRYHNFSGKEVVQRMSANYKFYTDPIYLNFCFISLLASTTPKILRKRKAKAF